MGGKIFYFDDVGFENTRLVVQAVKERVEKGDVKYVVVASISGETALKTAEALKDLKVKVVCVSGFSGWITMRGVKHPFIKQNVRKKLESLHVSIVENTPSPFSDTVDFCLARYGYIPATWFIIETFEAVGGYGLKTAVEAILMATDSGAIPPFTEVVSVAGTDKGADTAIVAKSTYSTFMFSEDSDRRFQILEIIAMPRKKKWYKSLGVGGLSIQEIHKGESLSW